MKSLIIRLFKFFEAHPIVLKASLIGVVILLLSTILHIHFVEDIGKFFPDKESNQRINYAYQHIGTTNKIVVTISSQDSIDRDKITEAVDITVDKLNQIDSYSGIKEIFYAVNQEQITSLTDFIIQNIPYFLSESDYNRLDTAIQAKNIEELLLSDKEMLLSPVSGFVKNIIAKDPLHFSSNALAMLNKTQDSGNYELYNGYLFTKDGQEAMIIITSKYPASETSGNKLLINDIEKVLTSVETEFSGSIKVDMIGASVISVSNASQIKKDSLISTLIALTLILSLLLFFFRDIKALFIILFALLFGGLFGLAFLTILKDSISIIAIGIGSIISGIAVNYPLHFLAHYQHCHNKEKTIKEIVSPLIIGNITTVGAFLSLVFISSDAMRDLGLFSSFLLIGTILFVLIFLPHLFKKSLFNRQTHTTNPIFGKLAGLDIEKHKAPIFIILLLTIPLYFLSNNTTFETDLNAINYMTKDQRIKLDKLIKETESKNPVLYCISDGKEINEALENYERSTGIIDSLKREDAIIKSSGIEIFLPSKTMQKSRLDKWNLFWKDRRETFLKDFDLLSAKTGFSKDAFNQFKEIVLQKYSIQETGYFEPILTSFANNYISVENDKTLVFTMLETEKSKTNSVEEIINSHSGNTFAFNNKSFVEKLIEALSEDFNYVLYICGFIVFIVLTLSFGRLELSLIAIIPLIISWIWILGIMSLFGLKFNIVNIILASFIFGQGDDYTIFVTDGLIYEYKYGKKMLASYKNSILLSASIMFIGIGSLIIAKHPAIRSLAEVTIVGMLCVVLMSYLFPPLIYRWMTEKNGKSRKVPITLWNLIKTVYSFVIFLIGTLFLNLSGFILLTIGKRCDRNRELFHKIICKTLRITANHIPEIKYYIDSNNETFAKPGIIISNHQSHLDLMYLLMLNPKIICLTNKWVWNSPFYGWILRYADYYPIVEGIEANEEKLHKAINNGYSILIFPEGTRSADSSILRFHKGAFYLAEKFKTDIIPIILHGVGDIFPKQEFILRKGSVTLRILDRIKYNDTEYRSEKEYRQTAKAIRSLYQREYRKLSDSIETPDYFANMVYHNYLYKGADIARNTKRLLKSKQNFKKEIELLPDHGVYHINNCGYGEMALLAALVKKDLQIIATDPDKEKLAIASNCAAIPKNLKFVENGEE